MNIQIRLEQYADYRESEQVMREAFWNRYSPGCTEHYLLHIMRESPGFIPELDFVAVADGRIVGCVVFMKSFILGDDGKRYDVLGMGPIGVHPAFQRKGIGRMLIEHALAAAENTGYLAVLLCGDPAYYTKVGFTAAEHFGIRTAGNKYFAALHIHPFDTVAMNNAAGRYFEDKIYDVDEAAAMAFDMEFPPEERLAGTPSQRRFEEILAMQKDVSTEHVSR